MLHVVDDASGDDSLKNIKLHYGDLNGKIRYYQLQENKKQAGTLDVIMQVITLVRSEEGAA